MKTKFLLFSFAIIFSNFSFSQPDFCISKEKREKLRSEKIAFISNKLDLTVEEAQTFWPLYNEFEKKMDELLEKRRNLMCSFSDKEAFFSNQEVEKMSDELINLEVQQAQLQQEYHARFKKILPIKKVVRFYQSENQFKNHLLKKLGKKGEREKNN